MKRVYKYQLDIRDEQLIDMPQDAQLLTVNVQSGVPCLWALVEPSNPTVSRRISMRGTGHPAEGLGRYISTFLMSNDSLVFHVFDGPQ